MRACVLLGLVLLVPTATVARGDGGRRERYIIVLRDGASEPGEVAGRLADELGADIPFVYRHALRGFAIDIPYTAQTRLEADPRIAHVSRDCAVEIAAHRSPPPPPTPSPTPTAQVVPTSVRLVGALAQTAVRIDGTPDFPNVDIAILDTGIALGHPDLNIAGGACFTGENTTGDDNNGHGTFVAGLAAAQDNTIGIVGVCPGARLWAVKVLKADGTGDLSTVVAGVDWLLDTSKHPPIAIANMSFVTQDPGTASDPLHPAIRTAAAQGIFFSAAAGNDGQDASGFIPASYGEVVCVSALADSDGALGAVGVSTSAGPDDSFAEFSNFGSVVAMIAPGVDVESTWIGPAYAVGSGTSFSAPLVAGGAALYKYTHPLATPSQTRSAILSLGVPAPPGGWPNDPDGALAEPLLDVRSFTPPAPAVLVNASTDRPSYVSGVDFAATVTARVVDEVGHPINGLAPGGLSLILDGRTPATAFLPTSAPGSYAAGITLGALVIGPHALTVTALDTRGLTGRGSAIFTTTLAAPPPSSGTGGGCACAPDRDERSACVAWLLLLAVLGAARWQRSGSRTLPPSRL